MAKPDFLKYFIDDAAGRDLGTDAFASDQIEAKTRDADGQQQSQAGNASPSTASLYESVTARPNLENMPEQDERRHRALRRTGRAR